MSQLELSPDLTAAAERFTRALAPSVGWSDAIDALRNVALFAGFGAVWIATSTASHIGPAIRRATLLGLGLSALVESVQLFSPVRTASVLDLATNAGGTFCGALGAAWLIAAVHRARGARSYLGLPAFVASGAYGIAVVCEAITPLFRSEGDPDAHGSPLARLQLMLQRSVPVELWQLPWLDVPLYAAAAFLAVVLLAELGWDARGRWVRVAALGAACAVVLEVAHGGLGVSIRWEAAVTHALAVAFGAWAAQRGLPTITQTWRGAARARVALAAYALLLALWAWRPLLPRLDLSEIAAQLSPSRLIPMESVASRADAFSALHVLQQFFLYFPLGALLAVWPLRLRGPWAHLRPALVFALALEVGHLVIEERMFDVNNVLLAWAGIALGWLVLRRSGFAPYGEALTPR